jgi:hypothetical protein
VKTDSRPFAILFLLLGLAGAARGGILWLQAEELSRDRDAYLQIAHNLAEGRGFSSGNPPHPTAYRPPLYPLLLAGIFAAGGGIGWVGVAQGMLGLGTVLLTLHVGRRLGLGNARYLAALLVALDPLLVQSAALPMTETLCACLVSLWLSVEVGAMHEGQAARQCGRQWLSGLIFGACCLCRPTFLALLPLFPIEGIAKRLRTSTISAGPWKSWRDPVRELRLPLLAGVAVALLPWMVRNSVVLGKATPATTHGGYTLLLGNNPIFYEQVVGRPWGTVWDDASFQEWSRAIDAEMSQAQPAIEGEAARDRWMSARAWRNIREQPGWFVQAALWRVVRLWDLSPHGSSAAGLPRVILWGIFGFYFFSQLGLLLGLWSLNRQQRHLWSPLMALLLCVTLVHLLYWTDMRMRAPLIPVVSLLAAQGWRAVFTCRRPPGTPLGCCPSG